VASMVGLKFIDVTIKPTPGSLGSVRYRAQRNPDSLYRERRIITGFAGQFAEARRSGRHPRHGMRHHNRTCADLAFSLHHNEKTVEAYLHYCWCVAGDWVDCHWTMIEALAAALLKYETVPYRDLMEIILPKAKALSASLEKIQARRTA
jgi:hypothetical protein